MQGAGRPDMLQMLMNLSSGFDALFQLIFLVFTFAGVMLFAQGLFDMYRAGTGTASAGGKQKTAASITARMLIAVALTSIYPLVNATEYTLAGAPSSGGLLVYVGGGASAYQKAAMMAIFGAFRLAGYVACGRGWMLLDKHFNGGNEGVGGPIIHIIAGTMLVFLFEWMSILMGWVGMDVSNILF